MMDTVSIPAPWAGEFWELTVDDVAVAYPELQNLGQADTTVVGARDWDAGGEGSLGESLGDRE